MGLVQVPRIAKQGGVDEHGVLRAKSSVAPVDVPKYMESKFDFHHCLK